MLLLVSTSVVSDAMSGLLVACILLKLDNVAKEYSAAASNIILALLCAKIFPEQFQLNAWVVLSLGFLLAGVVVYERNRKKKKDGEHDTGQFEKLRLEAV